MPVLLTIGEFARATHLSVKALRHYDDVGLLHPADVDPSSGYRRYASAQVPIAHVIRRFRELDMPLEQVRQVLGAPDLESRNEVIVSHLEQMQRSLEQTQASVASLKALLDGDEPTLPVEYRSVPAMPAVAISGDVDWHGTARWLGDAFGELHQVLATTPHLRAGVDAALFSTDLYETHHGAVVAFVPVTAAPRLSGRAQLIHIPAADLAVIVHHGPFSEIDRAYGSLGTFVAERVLSGDGPIREHYLVTSADTDDATQHQVEVAWPIRRLPS